MKLFEKKTSENIVANNSIPDLQERVKLELSIIMEDYRAQIKSIDIQIQIQHQVFSLTITAIGIILAASPFIVEFKVPLVFGFASLVFYGLSLAQLRHVWTVLAIDKYILHTLIPDIKNTINKMPPQGKFDTQIFKWAETEQRNAYTMKWWQFPIEAARYLIPVVAGLSCMLAYWFTPAYRIILIDYTMLALNIFWPIYIIYVTMKLRTIFLWSKEKKTQNLADN